MMRSDQKSGPRLALRSDIPVIMRIRAAVHENRLSDPAKVPARLVEEYIDQRLIWVWEEGGRVLGFSAANTSDGTIWALFVEPSAEGRGIGRDLISLAVRDLSRTGWTEARLSTEIGSRAEGFYRHQGWEPVGVTEQGERVLRKALGSEAPSPVPHGQADPQQQQAPEEAAPEHDGADPGPDKLTEGRFRQGREES